MPRFTLHESGGFPTTIKQLNLYPELCFHHHGFEIWMKCNEEITKRKTEEKYTAVILIDPKMTQKSPYFLESKISAENGHAAVDIVINAMEDVTDRLTFQLQYPVKI